MRRGQILLVAFVVLLLAVPVAGADDSHSKDAGRAAGLTAVHVTLQAWAQPLGAEPTSVAFEYGPTSDYGTRVAATPKQLPPHKGAMASAVVSGLQRGRVYHYRVVRTAANVRVAGNDETFTTASRGAKGPTDKRAKPEPAKSDKPEAGKPAKRTGDAPDDKSNDTADNRPKPVDAPKAPVLARSLAVGPRAGSVTVLEPHSRRFVPLTAGDNVPSGSVVDATKGTVALTSALDRHGKTQTGEFTGGRFLVRQSKRGMVDIYLRGSIGSCRARTAGIARARKPRALWGRDHHGHFRTHGATSVATVR